MFCYFFCYFAKYVLLSSDGVYVRGPTRRAHYSSRGRRLGRACLLGHSGAGWRGAAVAVADLSGPAPRAEHNVYCAAVTSLRTLTVNCLTWHRGPRVIPAREHEYL